MHRKIAIHKYAVDRNSTVLNDCKRRKYLFISLPFNLENYYPFNSNARSRIYLFFSESICI